jgi:hypothetical protein
MPLVSSPVPSIRLMSTAAPMLGESKPDPPTKKARVFAPAKASRATYIPEDNKVEEDDLNKDKDILLKDKKQNASGKRA